MKESFVEPSGTSVEVPAEVAVARSEAAAALADVRYRLDVLRDSGETILVQVRRSARPVLVVAVASVALVCLWRLTRRSRPPRSWQPRQQPSLLGSTLRNVALSVARVALSRLIDRLVARATVRVVAERPAS